MPTIDFTPGLRQSIASNLSRHAATQTPATALKRAAVSIVVTADEKGQASMILTKRSRGLNNHAGQFALPGGRIDEGESEEQAALREMREEIGLALGPDALLGRLDDYPTRSGYLIAPWVAWADPDQPMCANPDEVAAIFHIPLSDLMLPGSPEFVSIPESDRPVIRYPLLGRLIHAPTAAVMYQFIEVAILGRDTRVAHLEQGVFAWR